MNDPDASRDNLTTLEIAQKSLVERLQEALAGGVEKSEQIASLAAACKALADAADTAQTRRDAAALRRNEAYKTFAMAVVPLLTLITLAVTVWMQGSQLAAQRESFEDVAWREMIGHFSKNGDDATGISTAAELKTFLRSPRYGLQARKMAILLLPRIGDPSAYRDLVDSTLGDANENNVADYIWLNQQATVSLRILDELLVDPKRQVQANRKRQSAPTPEELRLDQAAMGDEARLTSGRVAEVLRNRHGHSQPALVLSSMTFIDADLRGVNFYGFDLADCVFDRSDVSGALLWSIRSWEGTQWPSTNWWKANAVDPNALKALVEYWYPNRSGTEMLSFPISRAEYASDLQRLYSGTAPSDFSFGFDSGVLSTSSGDSEPPSSQGNAKTDIDPAVDAAEHAEDAGTSDAARIRQRTDAR